jgi:hypothetical protein
MFQMSNFSGLTLSVGRVLMHFLQADIVADDVIFNHLRSCPAVETASSEEQSDILPMGGRGYTVSRQHVAA